MIRRCFALISILCLTSVLRAAPPATPPTTRPATQPAAPKIDPAEFEKLAADKQHVILDVRTPAEFADGHLAGAVNLDYRGKDFTEKLTALDRDKTYLVYCAVGGRSTGACEKLSKLSFPRVYNLDGGIARWKREGKSIEK